MAKLTKSLGFTSLGPFLTCCQLIHLPLKPALTQTLRKPSLAVNPIPQSFIFHKDKEK